MVDYVFFMQKQGLGGHHFDGIYYRIGSGKASGGNANSCLFS